MNILRKLFFVGACLSFFSFCLTSQNFCNCGEALAQTRAPDRKYLFKEDRDRKEKKDKSTLEAEALSKKQKELSKLEKTGKLPVDIDAKNLKYDSAANKIHADGGLIVTYSSMVLEALKGDLDLNTNYLELENDVRISDVTGTIAGDAAKVKFKEGEAWIKNAKILFAQGGYKIDAKEVHREEGDIYQLKDAHFTTCQCAEETNCPPWRISANDTTIERNGYGKAKGATLDIFNVPVFYTPYLLFPAKSTRQTGLLSPSFGYSKTRGEELGLPLFIDIDDSTDATITGIYESKARYGFDSEFRKAFTEKNKLDVGLIYFDESKRGDSLLGTNADTSTDNSTDVNRFGGYLNNNLQGSIAEEPVQLLVKGKYVSDDLFLREYENPKIGKYNSRFVTSKAAIRMPIGTNYGFDLSSEYNQSLVSDDDFVFQRFPEAEVQGIEFVDLFGSNPFGLKLVANTTLNTTDFTRLKGYDGNRSEIYERLKVPFHYKNIFDASLEAGARGTYYSMNEVDNVEKDAAGNLVVTDTLSSNSDRILPTLGFKANSVLEKVYQLDDDSLLKDITELGSSARTQQLSRIKHTIEPGVKYRFIPSVDQKDTPQFDSLDHIDQKNVVTYQLTQRIFGRFTPRNQYLYGIEETSPELGDIVSNPSFSSPLSQDTGYLIDENDTMIQRVRSGDLKELATLKIFQSYDILEREKNLDPSRDAVSDLGADIILYPNDYLSFRERLNFNVQDNSFSSYISDIQLEDKRGDRILARLRFLENQERQLEANAEFVLTDNVKFGFYNRYDDFEGKFIEQKVGLRYKSSCNCWVFDIDLADRINPDETRLTFNFTFVGLGDLAQKFDPPINDISRKKKKQP